MSELSERFINVTGTERITELGLSYIKENTGYDAAVRLDGHSTAGQPDTAGAVLFPIRGIARKTGEIIVCTKDRGLGAEQEIFIRAVAGQMGIALDRERIYEKLVRLGASYKEHTATSDVVQLAAERVEQLETYFGRYLH